MKALRKAYITTAIDYPSGRPHLGHAYEKILADSIVRKMRLDGTDVFFSTGTDEHGIKIQRKAEEAKTTPKQYVDGTVVAFKKMMTDCDVNYSRFIRTTDEDHAATVTEVFNRIYKNGDIYKEDYEGLYCHECERYYIERDLLEGQHCPTHTTRKLEVTSEKNYIFKMSKYEGALLKHFEENPDFIYPKRFYDETVERVKGGLKDLSVTRTTFSWGIRCPVDEEHIMYVWIDALSNYLTSIGFNKSESFDSYWDESVHVIGKDIVWFHCVIWPCLLMAAGIKLPKQVFVHGFITVGGKKMAKSGGTVIDPEYLTTAYGSDIVRYSLLRLIPTGSDGVFTEKLLCEMNNTELANKLGNLAHRTVAPVMKVSDGRVPKRGPVPDALKDDILKGVKEVRKYYDNFEFSNAMLAIAGIVDVCDRYLNTEEPWKTIKVDKEKALNAYYYTLEALRILSILYEPVLPKAAATLRAKLGFTSDFKPLFSDALEFGLLAEGQALVDDKEVLFKKLEAPEVTMSDLDYAKKIERPDIPSCIYQFSKLKLQKRTAELEKMKKETVAGMLAEEGAKWAAIRESTLTKEYEAGIGKLDYGVQPSTIGLLESVKKSKQLPVINTLVDTYNLFSIKYGVVMGVYDRKGISGDIELREARGDEKFTPVGGKAPEKITPGEYVYVDDDNNVVTRIFSKQADNVKVEVLTTDAVMCVQGNATIALDELKKIAEECAQHIQKFCGGEYKLIKAE